MRLQKVLAQAGFASRRKAEEIIQAGRVQVNGRVVTELGAKADPKKDKVEVDGRRLGLEEHVTVLLNKPRGVVCTASDPEGRETVVDLVRGLKTRLFPVGRLDFATSGAVLLTNDGELAYALTHPRFGVEKIYLLKIRGQISEEVLRKWRKGIDIGDIVTSEAKVRKVEEDENYTWIEVTIHEGRNRQIRRMGDATGIDVIKLKRIAFAGLTIDDVRVGQYRKLTEQELARLKRDYVNPSKKSKRTIGDKKQPSSQPSRQPGSRRRREDKT